MAFVLRSKDQTAWANQQLANSIQIYEDKSGHKSIDDIRLLPEFEFKKAVFIRILDLQHQPGG